MNISLEQAKKDISISCNILNPDSQGYVADNVDIGNNLIDRYDNWPEIKNEISKGQGNELTVNKYGLRPFNAVHSSAALCVNNFAPIKLQLNGFFFQNINSFTLAEFEKKIKTGISTPNLDFYLETKEAIIGFESKYTEILTRKFPNNNNDLGKYINRKQLKYLSSEFINLINEYIYCESRMYLGVAQLIKHAIGLIKNADGRRTTLVYIYWLPINWKKFEKYLTHDNEIRAFATKIQSFIDFQYMSYIDFWNLYEKNATFGDHFRKVRNRYSIKLNTGGV